MAFAFSFLNGQLPAHEEAVPHLCVHTYIYIYNYVCTHAGRCLRGPGPGLGVRQSGQGQVQEQPRLVPPRVVYSLCLKLCIDQARRCPGPENGMEDPGFGRPFGIPGHDQVFLQAADGCVPCCRDHMDEAPGHPGAGAANEPGSQIVLAETMQQVSTAQLDGSTTMPRSRDTATVSFVC